MVSMKKNRSYTPYVALAIVFGYLLVVWSWVLLVDATLITSDSIASHTVRTMTLVISVGVSIAVFWRFIVFLHSEYQKQKTSHWQYLVKFFFVWAFAEWLVSWSVAAIWFGSNASIDSVYPFGSLTPLLAYTPLLFAARFVGFYGLSALVVTCIVALCAPKLRKYAVYVIGLLVILPAAGWFLYSHASGPNIAITTTSEALGQEQTVKTDAELIIFGEYALDEYDPHKSQKRIIPENDQEVFFVGSRQTPAQKGIHNTMLFGSTKQGILSEQDKNRLIPGGEYLPYNVEAVLVATRQTGARAEFEVLRAVQKGDGTVNSQKVRDGVVVGAEVCSSIVSMEDYRRLTNEGATLLTNSASLGVFGGSRVYRISHNGMARFMAVANARPFVQAAQDESAYFLNHNGNNTKNISPVSYATQDVQLNDKHTLYTLAGDWPVYIGAVYVLYAVVAYLQNYFVKKRD